MTKTIGVVLAGGNSTRFGEDKAFFKIDGRPMYSHVAGALEASSAIDEIVISTNQRLADCFDGLQTIVDDVFQDDGPLGGLYEVAKAFPGDRLLVVSCDAPYVSPEWLSTLYRKAVGNPDALVITKAADRLHPLIGVYQGADLPETIRQLLDARQLSMHALFEERGMIEVDAVSYGINDGTFVNMNRKTDIRFGGDESGEYYR
ncbi:molybdenum cofactor guanylyltransferase [Salinicoccus hispanicus]|uniref:Probable molybdenum cofactor guanylyltransferase n=1 Tax=Salinicoccus hispanicus TaxID=157225 RepID=A0A6N8TYZ1_9STAP|nr:molybdenum cofactor guanylyltransferase [Salinicoccus hispanicus]MXQ50692.1 NTP transferase domain-containing protein [Salinicoccus hispanicus]